MAKQSRLKVSDIKAIPFDKKARAELVKLIAQKEGVTVRTAQRRITSAGQKRGQSKQLDIKTGNAVRKFLREHPVVQLTAHGRTKTEVRGNTLIQEVFSSREDAINRARELQAYANNQETYTLFTDDENPFEWRAGVMYTEGELVDFDGQSYRCVEDHVSTNKTAPPFDTRHWVARDDDFDEEEEFGGEGGVNNPDLYPGSLYDNIHEIDVQYVPEGSRYTEGDVHHRQTLTAPAGGLWVVVGSN